MKKIIAMALCLVLALSMVGCGKNDNEGVVVGGDTCPAITVDGVTYYENGRKSDKPEESKIEYVEMPIEGEGTTGTINAIAQVEEGKTLVCLIGDEWYEFVVK